MMEDDEIRLNHFDREEWWDVCQRVYPLMSREEFDECWDAFILLMHKRTLQ
jgi:hypothetical protein